MYTTVVGRTFLKEYNRRNGREYSAKEFFDKELFQEIFNHKKYLLWAGNSPFVQGLSKEKPFFEPAERLDNLEKLHVKIGSGERDASIALGFPASETKGYATTSGLVTDLVVPTDEEAVYLSWIGGTLSLGVAGGYTILFDDPEITYTTFEGWKHYRRFLNDPLLDKLPPYKLNTWNGQWLSYRYDEYFDERFNLGTLIDIKAISTDEKGMEINTASWSKLFFSLSNSLEIDSVTAYVFSLGSTNKTVGFIPFQFQSGKTLIATYQALFGGETEYKIRRTSEFENWFGRHIKRACEMGSIGLQALRPETLKNYFGDRQNLKFLTVNEERKKSESEEEFSARLEKSKTKSREIIITYQTYKTWLIAMLSKNKTEISDYSRDIAQALVRYREGGRKNDRKNLLENDFFKTNKNEMLKALNIIVSDETVDKDIVERMNGLRDQVHFLSKEDFTYFVLLLKFDYAYAERNLNNQ
jgi:hypothetical protein